MKSITLSNAALNGLVAVFILLKVNHAFAGTGTMVETVTYQNERIPCITLNEVTIRADNSAQIQQVFPAVEYRNSWIPSIQLNEVTIKSTGVYNSDDLPKEGLRVPVNIGQKVNLVKYKNEWIPAIDLKEVQIVAAPLPADKSDAEVIVVAQTAEGREKFTISARQSFDVLLNFIVEKTLAMVRHIMPV